MKVLITGGASGLGSAITTLLASEGFKVFFTYNSSVDKAKIIESEYPNSEGIKCDFRSETELKSLLSSIEILGIDVLINNALLGTEIKHFHKINPSYFLENFQNNIVPTIQITQSFIKSSRKRKFGKIINILSSAIINTPPIGWSEYVASKSYLRSLSNSWATENIKFNITSNCISPEFMNTPLHTDLDDRVFNSLVENHPLRKILEPEEVAEIVLFYIKSSQHINGTNFIVNTGSNIS